MWSMHVAEKSKELGKLGEDVIPPIGMIFHFILQVMDMERHGWLESKMISTTNECWVE